MPRRFGFGLGFNLTRSLGGAPAVPSGFVARYLSSLVSSMSLVTGDNVEQWDDQSANNNDLTQSISANQPTLLEYDVVKQSTLANMPTFDYDKVLTQDTGANQPTLVDTGGGVLAMGFTGGKLLTGLIPQTGDFSY